MEAVYLDTSALAKWYINEHLSARVEAFVRKNAPLAISSLTDVEMCSLLARRRREGAFDAGMESRAYATFREDVRRGFLVQHPVTESAMTGASKLFAMLPEIPLRTLDAMQLAIAQDLGCGRLATADKVMAAAAAELGFSVVRFFQG